ncbi:hypothetical protein EV714DRAFT_240199 [Schizophyllum commune]
MDLAVVSKSSGRPAARVEAFLNLSARSPLAIACGRLGRRRVPPWEELACSPSVKILDIPLAIAFLLGTRPARALRRRDMEVDMVVMDRQKVPYLKRHRFGMANTVLLPRDNIPVHIIILISLVTKASSGREEDLLALVASWGLEVVSSSVIFDLTRREPWLARTTNAAQRQSPSRADSGSVR